MMKHHFSLVNSFKFNKVEQEFQGTGISIT